DAVPVAARECEPRFAYWRCELRERRDALRDAFFATPDTPLLLREHARLGDRVMRGVWAECAMPGGVAAIAVGGYGRGQLFPHSDVDVLILLPPTMTTTTGPLQVAIEKFITACWDIGLEIGSSVRTVSECIAIATSDVTVQTALLES